MHLLVCCSVAAVVEVGEGGVKAEQCLLALTAAQLHALQLPGSHCSLRGVPSTCTIRVSSVGVGLEHRDALRPIAQPHTRSQLVTPRPHLELCQCGWLHQQVSGYAVWGPTNALDQPPADGAHALVGLCVLERKVFGGGMELGGPAPGRAPTWGC